jgi:ATP-dependent 26S proteasome regulatory subunit
VTGELAPGDREVAESIASVWSRPLENGMLSFAQLTGTERTGKFAVSGLAARALNMDLYALEASQLPTDPREFESLQRAWERQALLSGCALLLNAQGIDEHDAAHWQALTRWMEETRGAYVVAVETRKAFTRANVALEVKKPSAQEQRELWQTVTGERAAELDGALDRLVSQFDLDADAIRAANAEALHSRDVEFEDALWDACRVQARPRLDNLAMRIEARAGWDDIVLPNTQLQILQEIAVHVRQRQKVYETWGWSKKQTRGLGISALFAGATGTGKTMAGEVLADELRLDLYRIDLSAVVSKYVGETEKNLKQVFDAAEAGGAILLFDEADALFGKRSQVQDSHDRYANIEISYLLQRMEQYRGLAILTTNMQEAIDKAFLRRIRFVVNFPFPDYELRKEIWRRIFPKETPIRALDSLQLARLNIAGGNIRNIALNASFLAANDDEPVQMHHLLRAAQSEYDKIDKKLTDAEIREWRVGTGD